MKSRRVLKAAEAIRQVVGAAILTDLRDPRIQDVTVTFVEVSSDLRYAKVHVSIMGDERKQELALSGLRHAAGFLQTKVNNRINTRYTPRIEFVLDQGVKRSIEVTRILQEVLPESSDDSPDAPPGDEAAPGREPGAAETSQDATTPEDIDDAPTTEAVREPPETLEKN
jgi:ribosome-binding factor A